MKTGKGRGWASRLLVAPSDKLLNVFFKSLGLYAVPSMDARGKLKFMSRCDIGLLPGQENEGIGEKTLCKLRDTHRSCR